MNHDVKVNSEDDVLTEDFSRQSRGLQERAFRRLMVALLLVYWAYYWVRSPMSVSMTVLGLTHNLSKSHIGIVISCGYASQAIGKLVSGAVIDRTGGKAVLFGALALSTLSALLFGVFGISSTFYSPTVYVSVTLYAILWSFNRIGQSAAWGAILKILTNWMNPKKYGSLLGLFALSYGLGDAINRLVLGLLLKSMDWYWLWFIGGSIATIMALPCYFVIHETPEDLKKHLPISEDSIALTQNIVKSAAVRGEEGVWQSMKPILMLSRFWALLFMYVLMTMIREIFLSWVSIINVEVLKFDDSTSAVLSLIFPLFGCISAIWGGKKVDKTSIERQDAVALWFLFSLLLSLISLSCFVSYTASMQTTVGIQITGVILLSSVAFCMEAPYTFIDGVYSLRLSGSKSPALTVGILQAAANIGAVASGYLCGVISETWGWAVMVGIMTGQVFLVIIAALLQFRH